MRASCIAPAAHGALLSGMSSNMIALNCVVTPAAAN
jgi:hypothetical protein